MWSCSFQDRYVPSRAEQQHKLHLREAQCGEDRCLTKASQQTKHDPVGLSVTESCGRRGVDCSEIRSLYRDLRVRPHNSAQLLTESTGEGRGSEAGQGRSSTAS